MNATQETGEVGSRKLNRTAGHRMAGPSLARQLTPHLEFIFAVCLGKGHQTGHH
jgi:hypothetical protein